MLEHLKTLTNIKSDLLNVCIDALNINYCYDDYVLLIQNNLKRYFDISKSCVLIYEGKSIYPIIKKTTFKLDHSNIPGMEFSTCFSQEKFIEMPNYLSAKYKLQPFSHLLLLKSEQSSVYAVLLFESTSKWTAFSESEFFEDFVDNHSKVLNMLCKNVEIRQNENQYLKLYNMTDLFHSTMDINLILENILITIQDNFPDLKVEIILSNDQDRQTTVQIKQFDYLSERPSAIEAFVSGEIIIEQALDLNSCLLNAPINGRQAIYGILQVSAPLLYTYTNAQQDFIRMLAHASGNALENAKLYHQSRRLISNLQLINETSHRLNMKLDRNEMFMFLHKQLMKSFQPMELCFAMKSIDSLTLTEGSTKLFETEEGKLYINYVAKHFESSQEPLFIADFSRLISKEIQFNSMMAIPMIVEQRINGFSIVLHRDSYFFSFDSFKLMQSLIHHSSLAIANSILRNQLQEMVDYDHLTKLHARSFLDQFVESSLSNDSSGMFLLVDVDNFKLVNDTYGHQVGDEVLVQIANQLKNIVGTRGICARWGGEEIAVYIPNVLVDEAIKLSHQIVNAIPEATNPTVTISAGLITWDSKQKPDFNSIFIQADIALYNAKSYGKNKVSIFNESMILQS